jgi:hypothetical protein
MFRSKFLNKNKSDGPSQSKAVPVYQPRESQKEATQEKENEEIISCSQELSLTQNPTRSRFISQRQAIFNATQQQVRQGKGSLEVVLYSCGLEITSLGELLSKCYEIQL